MRIIVCVKQVPDTTEVRIDPVTHTMIRAGVPSILNPEDANALEEALRIKDVAPSTQVIALTMGPPQASAMLRECLAMGADEAVLLSDRAFAGADTWATSNALASAIRSLGCADIVFVGRQAIDGDTAQVGPEIAALCGMPVRTGVMQAQPDGEKIRYATRTASGTLPLPAVLTFEKGLPLRFPSIRSRIGTVERWSNADLHVDPAQCGWAGSPTRVLQTYENTQGRRKCQKITYDQLPEILRRARTANHTVRFRPPDSDSQPRAENSPYRAHFDELHP